MITAVDTNVLLDIVIPGAPHARESLNAVGAANLRGEAVVAEVVVAELSTRFRDENELWSFLATMGVRVEPLQFSSLWSAGREWRRYHERRGDGITCGACGTAQLQVCPNCGAAINYRQRVLPDFIIGAHAAHQADCLLTRDRRFYRSYFPQLTLVE